MTHPNFQTNGASLEDCHTNFFALTDLCGIQWRRLSAENVFCVDPLEDPVLVSFAKCLGQDILCVWRKVQCSKNQDHSSDHPPYYNKELWIFWYGSEPDLSNIICPELAEIDQGSWDSGLSYECRTLLFKALHNLIERCLLSRDFVRLGRWFVQPYDFQEKPGKSPHLTFSFSFFIHGESTVCATVDVRQHPPVYRLSHFHLQVAQGSHSGLQVMLGPYGLSGILTGQTYKDLDHSTLKLLDEWRQYYPIDPNCCIGEVAGEGSTLPHLVEVVVGGVKMRYPSCYVLVMESEEVLASNAVASSSFIPSLPSQSSVSKPSSTPVASAGMSSVPLTPPTSPCESNMMAMASGGKQTSTGLFAGPSLKTSSSSVQSIASGPHQDTLTHKLTSRVWQDSSLALDPARSLSSENLVDQDTVGHWDNSDPSQKATCNCSKCKKTKSAANQPKPSVSGTSSSSQAISGNKKGDKTDKQQPRHLRGMTPFHRRSPVNDDISVVDSDLVSQRVSTPGNPSYQFKGSGSCSGASGGLPQLRTSLLDPITAGASPHSSAPSPLVASHSQPASVTQADPTMPTLSPHPPASKDQDLPPLVDETSTAESNSVPNNTSAASPLDLNKEGPKSVSDQVFSPYPSNLDQTKTSEIISWTQSQGTPAAPIDPGQGLKRPILPSKVYEDQMEEELLSDSLYDYAVLSAWLNHPVKKFKMEPKTDPKSNSRPGSVSDSQPSPLGANMLKEPLTPQSHMSSIDMPPKQADPYEFEDETPTVLNMPGFKKAEVANEEESTVAKDGAAAVVPAAAAVAASDATLPPAKDAKPPFGTEPVASPPTPVNSTLGKNKLLTSQDLRPTYNDLDQLFDTSDEDGNDDPFQAPTPTGSLKAIGSSGDDGGCGKNKTSDMIGLHGPTDISRMFPTPPSLEHNPTPSPIGVMGGTDSVPMEGGDVGTVACKERTDAYPSYGSPTEEGISDWSYVFKPPPQAKFVGSSKYTPLTNLPSQAAPQVTLPSHCVYKPSWQFPLPIIDKHTPTINMSNLPSVESMDRMHGSVGRSMEPSPATFGSSLDHRMPNSYELTSPASNASSYLNKNVNSIDNSGTMSQVSEAHSLLVNVVLSDSLMNLFKDHNFDTCTMCVCQMDVCGADARVYLPQDGGMAASKESLYKCTCGFSAVVNRKYGYQAGLLYEDEVEITGVRDDSIDRRKPSLLVSEANKDTSAESDANKELDQMPQYLLELLRLQSTTMSSSYSILYKTSRLYQSTLVSTPQNTLEMKDGCEMVFSAIDYGRQAVDNLYTGKLDEALKQTCLHKWPHIQAKLPPSCQDMMRLLRSLQPLLQDAIQKKRTTGMWEMTHSVSGPLTWRQFHRLVGRGTEDQCEPQPIPSLLVGYDKDWLALSPFAVKYWEKLLLEPYSLARDIAYVVVAPNNEYILNNVKSFFKELSGTYEVCRLGRHCPISTVLRDGIMRVGKTQVKNLADEPVDEWFNLIGDASVATKLKLYAQACRHHLAPYLAMQTMDRTLLDNPTSTKTPEKTTAVASPMPPPTPENQDRVPTPKSADINEPMDTSSQGTPKESLPTGGPPGPQEPWDQDDEVQVPAIVVYVVDPFTYASDHPELHRLANIGLLRCYAQLLRYLPENMQNNMHLQVVPLDTILEHSQNEESSKRIDHLKALAFSVFSQCRRTLIHQSTAKSLTGFGTAAAMDTFLKSKDEKNSAPYRMYSPPFILAPMKDKQTELGESFGDRKEKCSILYCSYCLSEDQRWLLGTCTDDRGEIVESVVINVEIPNRSRRKKASARKVALQKLMDWILGVMSTGIVPWRLVIGRLGRLGHGELKGWSSLLSRKFLLRASKHLKDMCKQCLYLAAQDTPCILSACLISTEPDPKLRVMSDQFTPDERFGISNNSCELSTPQDASCTHILVFPTSATTQSSQASLAPEPSLEDDDELLVLMKEEMMKDDDLQVENIFEWDVCASPVGSPRKESISLPGSPGIGVSGRQSPLQNNGPTRGSDSLVSDSQEEAPQLLQQPLALGYYVSTAKTGAMPKWFWSSCNHLEDICPAFLKSALHIHSPAVQQSSDDPLQHPHSQNYHPLDSNLTTDVLRYVLEGYNALSWLSIDPVTHDRRSCLPVHIQVLVQLYCTLAPLV